MNEYHKCNYKLYSSRHSFPGSNKSRQFVTSSEFINQTRHYSSMILNTNCALSFTLVDDDDGTMKCLLWIFQQIKSNRNFINRKHTKHAAFLYKFILNSALCLKNWTEFYIKTIALFSNLKKLIFLQFTFPKLFILLVIHNFYRVTWLGAICLLYQPLHIFFTGSFLKRI